MATATSFVSPALHPKPEAFPVSSLRPPPKGSGSNSYRSRRNILFSPSKSKHSISISRLASNPPPSTPEKPPRPQIELEFVGVTPHILFVFSPHPKASRIPSFMLLSSRGYKFCLVLAAEGGSGWVISGGQGFGNQWREASPRHYARQQDRALRRIRNAHQPTLFSS